MTSSSSGSLSTSDSTMDRLRGHQKSAATNIADSDSFQKLEGNEELGNIVKNTHGTISTASFAGVRAALKNRGTASTRLKTESLSLADKLPIAKKNYNEAGGEAAKRISGSMPST
jgi:hypothetical protein